MSMRKVAGELPVSFRYTPGVGNTSFFEGLLDRGAFVGSRCPECELTYVPSRLFCERCFRPTDEWAEVSSTGTVETFSICHVTWDMRPLDAPELPAVIRLDGASSGGFLHMLGDVAPDDVSIGMRVSAVWKPLEERHGSILDISHFAPEAAS